MEKCSWQIVGYGSLHFVVYRSEQVQLFSPVTLNLSNLPQLCCFSPEPEKLDSSFPALSVTVEPAVNLQTALTCRSLGPKQLAFLMGRKVQL
nr:hypothetical protein CFP56_38653 [Quercus suber]